MLPVHKLTGPKKKKKKTFLQSQFYTTFAREAIPINYTSEFRETFEATTNIFVALIK